MGKPPWKPRNFEIFQGFPTLEKDLLLVWAHVEGRTLQPLIPKLQNLEKKQKFCVQNPEGKMKIAYRRSLNIFCPTTNNTKKRHRKAKNVTGKNK